MHGLSLRGIESEFDRLGQVAVGGVEVEVARTVDRAGDGFGDVVDAVGEGLVQPGGEGRTGGGAGDPGGKDEGKPAGEVGPLLDQVLTVGVVVSGA